MLLTISVSSQTIEDWEYSPPITDNNMSVVFTGENLIDFSGGVLMAFASDVPVSGAQSYWSEGYYLIEDDGTAGIAVIGTDNLCSCDLADNGEEIEFYLMYNGAIIVNVNVNPPIVYQANAFFNISTDYSVTFTIENNPVEFGCTDPSYLEFDVSANIDDASCSTFKIIGCIDEEACNFNEDANYDNGSCLYLDFEESIFNACCLGNSITSICILDIALCDTADVNCLNLGCMEVWADNYDPFITVDDGSCDRLGCASIWADNYDVLATTDDGTCFRYGCTSGWSENYDELSTMDNGTCYLSGCLESWADNYDANVTVDNGSCFKFGCLYNWADNYDYQVTISDSSCFRYGCTNYVAFNYDELATSYDGSCLFNLQLTELLDSLTIVNEVLNESVGSLNSAIYLQEGWNIIGYGCGDPVNVIDALATYSEDVILLKDNNGAIYMPNFGFNGIGDFIPGFGYQVKLSEPINNFNICE